ncbi:unnamed protein product [Rangifer tarandus platyrhynchus]|uniref:Uncharacterized protein n=2 Tax=Rangifer tarandus platyrhynchus TaxID=3082113 RepID=A0ABN8Y0C3_RANTA|nr:unnamed protein product [Rangifer tarandus platyrhynchus]CAI9692698.1 unnamed protein product [Rangifer tarandus platyrhynchus]
MSSTLLRSGRVDVRKLCNQSSLVRGVPPSPTTCSEPSAEPSEMSRAEGTARSSSGQSPVREEERDQAGWWVSWLDLRVQANDGLPCKWELIIPHHSGGSCED